MDRMDPLVYFLSLLFGHSNRLSSRVQEGGGKGTPYPLICLSKIDSLSILVDKATERGFLSGFSFEGRDGATLNLSHLLFADNTLVFYKDSKDQIPILA